MAGDEIQKLLQRLYQLVDELEKLAPGRRFTPDGHLIGSIGELIGKEAYGLTLLPASYPTHDAESDLGPVQIKATQGQSVRLYGDPDHLLVLKLNRDGTFEEAYNGPGALAVSVAGKKQKNGQRPLSLSKLRSLMSRVSERERLPRSTT